MHAFARRLRTGPVYLVLIGLALGFALLLIPLRGDGSYTCRGSALEDLIRPEPQESAYFRAHVAFDSGYQCNQDAKFNAAVAGVVVTPFVATSIAWAYARRRSGIYG